MIDSHDFLHFDLFQRIVLWLNVSMHTPRKGRRYLENNPILLGSMADKELERLITAHAEDKKGMRQQMRNHQELLREVRRHGGTTKAIHEAYVEMYGGLALDLPAWLAALEEQRMRLNHLNRPERTTRKQLTILHDAIIHAHRERNISPEITAQLRNEYGSILVQNPHIRSQTDQLEAYKQAIACHQAALGVYTIDRYPLQHAKTCMLLGNAYRDYSAIGQPRAIEQAFHYYTRAVKVVSREEHPEQWALLHTHAGRAYLQRNNGKEAENAERAIICHKKALQVVTSAHYPTVWASVQLNLGDAYRQRREGARDANLKQAMACYRAALQIYTWQAFPREWADVHIKLARIFRDLALHSEEKHDLNLRCAIVCCEGALQIYTPDAYPLEYATTLEILGQLHRERPGGDRLENLEQSVRSYRGALQIFTHTAFPQEYRQALCNLEESEAQRKELELALPSTCV